MIRNLPQTLIEAAQKHIQIHLYESLMLLENRIQYLKDNNPSIDTSHDTFATHNDPNDIIDHFANADPSKNKQHTQWILGQYKKKNIRQEDVGRIHDALTNFNRYKSKLDKKDLNQYKTLSDVERAIQPHLGTAATKKEESEIAETKGRTLIHDNGKGMKVYRLEPNEEGKKASQNIYGGGHDLGGCHTSWCTASRGDGNRFDNYSNQQPLHVIHTSSGEVYQAHPLTGQLMDSKDNNFNTNDKNMGEISSALDHIPDGWSLKIKNDMNLNKYDVSMGVDSDDWKIRAKSAKHKFLPIDKLTHVIKNDKDFHVRKSALENENITQEHLDYAINDPSADVREMVVKNKNATPEILNKGIMDKAYKVKSETLKNKNATAEILNKGINDSDFMLRISATEHHNATPEILNKALNDDNYMVKDAAASHHNATPEILNKALNDTDPYVRESAKNNPRAKEYGLV